MRFLNVVGIYPEKIDYMVSEAKRLYNTADINEVALCMTLHPQGRPAIEKPELFKKIFHEYKAKLAGSGIHVGVLIQSTIGHGWLGAACCKEDWQRAENINKFPVDRMCILDPNFRDYIYKMITLIAEEHPYSLLIDDDFRQINGRGLECFCPNHIKQFNDYDGKQYTADELREAIRDSEPGAPVLKRFESLRLKNMTSLAKLIRSAIDNVDPDIPCGCCTPGNEFLVEGKLAKIFAGKKEPFVRFCNANYLEGDAKNFPFVSLRVAHLRSMMPGIKKFLDEADTFPHNRYSKSAKSMHAKLVLGALNKEIGAKLWLTNLAFPDAYTERKYDEIMAKHRNFYPALMNIAQKAKPTGAVTPMPQVESYQKLWHPLYPEKCFYATDWQLQLFAHFGIPACYAPLGYEGIYLLSGDMLRFFNNEEVEQILSHPVFVDGTAAIELAKRGYESDLGVKVEQKRFRASCERVCATGTILAFSHDFSAPFLTPLSTKTKVLSELVLEDFAKSSPLSVISSGVTIFENKRGGKVAVWAQTLTMPRLLRPLRRKQLIEVLTELNGKKCPLYVEADQNVYTRSFELADGATMLAIFNLNFDVLENVVLKSDKAIQNIKYLSCAGKWEPIKYQTTDTGAVVEKELYTYDCLILKWE
ncbi:MAG: hypothetical protein WCS73_00910 [Lentisphaeria bacterium]